MSRAKVQQEYKVILRFPSGSERTWTVTDCYFDRRMEKIQREMLEQIRDNDRDMEFRLEQDFNDEMDLRLHKGPWADKKFQVELIRLDDCSVHREKFLAMDRYEAVSKAFIYFAHKPQSECLDTWKVCGVKEIES
jgi:hypothetical protein